MTPMLSADNYGHDPSIMGVYLSVIQLRQIMQDIGNVAWDFVWEFDTMAHLTDENLLQGSFNPDEKTQRSFRELIIRSR